MNDLVATLVAARERVAKAQDESTAAEIELTNALVDMIQEHLHQYVAGLRITVAHVKEIPERASLDHNTMRRETVKELEGIERQLRSIRDRLDALKGTTA